MLGATRAWFCYMKKEKKIDDRQFGFIKQRSTTDTISKLTTKILNGQMMEFRELISDRWIKVSGWIYIIEQIDSPGITTGESTKFDSFSNGN